MNKTSYKRALLAGAMKEGKPVHPGLRERCPSDEHDPCVEEFEFHIRGMSYFEYRDAPTCTDGLRPNPDPIALIAACQAQEMWLEFVILGEWHVVMIYDAAKGLIHKGYGLDNPSALTDAVFKATEALEPDNWVECNTSMHLDEGQDKDCPFCHGTGKVEVQDGS